MEIKEMVLLSLIEKLLILACQGYNCSSLGFPRFCFIVKKKFTHEIKEKD
jgi:hypothetical protein